jgi:CDGSH-type Zn-finger protein
MHRTRRATQEVGGPPLPRARPVANRNPAGGGRAGEVAMSDRVIAQKAPFKVELVAGETYWWCVCGRSAKQPFCDGSHKGTGLAPMRHVAQASGPAFFCGCKHTQRPPLCDGTHKSL